MRLKIEHTTTFTYNEPISEAYTEVRLRPLDAAGQHCLSFVLSTEPRADVSQYSDACGNDVRYFDLLQPHDRLVVSVQSQVLTPDTFQEGGQELTHLEQYDYLAETAYTAQTEALCQLAHSAAQADPYDKALALMQAVNGALKYERGATNVATTASQALELGKGVCQDFSHLMLAVCRCHKLYARYVSGYLYGQQAEDQEQATHAWVDVFVPGRGWVSLDPTHNTPQTANYVRVAVGRDYADVSPLHGVYTGKAAETLSVSVHVRAM